MANKRTNTDALRRAVKLAGGQTALGGKIGRNQSSIWNWLNTDQEVPAKLAKDIEIALAGQVTRAELRPDLFA